MSIASLTSALMISQHRFAGHAQRIAESGPEVTAVTGMLREETQFKAVVRTIRAEDQMRGTLIDILA